MSSWVLPAAHWRPAGESEGVLRRVADQAELLATWPSTAPEAHPTQVFRSDADYWILQPDFGGVRFTASSPEVFFYPLASTDLRRFELLVSRSWLPAIYPSWRRQVLHASAVATASGDVIAFSGPSGAGKSTLAYGLSLRAGWSLVADDTVAFACDEAHAGRPPALFPLRQEARLRWPTAAYFGKSAAVEVPFAWPDTPLRLRVVYVIGEDSGPSGAVDFTRLGVADAYTQLLAQAHALTLDVPSSNQRMMRDYLVLATSVSAFRFAFPRSFDRFDSVLDHVVSHAAATARTLNESDTPSGLAGPSSSSSAAPIH